MKDKTVLVYQLLCIALLIALVCVVFCKPKANDAGLKLDSPAQSAESLENKAEK